VETSAGLRAGLAATATRTRVAVDLARRATPVVFTAFVAVSLLAGVLPVAAAVLTKLVLDRITTGAGVAGVWGGAVALAATGLAVAAVPPTLRYLQAELDRSVTVRAKDLLYRTVNRIPLLATLEVPAFRDRLRLAEQASRSGPGQVVESTVGLAQSAVTLAGMIVAVAVIGPWVALLMLVSAVPALVAEIRLSRRRADLAWRISPAERREVFYGELLTDLSAAKEIRLFGSGRLFRRRMLAELTGANAEQRRYDRREAAVQVGLAAVSAVFVGAALVGVLLAAAGGALTPGDVAAVIVAVSGVQAALGGAVGHISTAHHAGLLLDHYRAVVDGHHEEAEPHEADDAPRAEGRGLELVDVWFRYGEDQPWVLRGVSATIAPGRAVALVGENGSGKSTLVKLLCRFYDPTRGSIRWDGVDLRDLPLEELRRRIGAVFQDFMCYDLSAAENIALGGLDGGAELDLDPAPIEDAARGAEVHAALDRLPEGYRTLLSRMFVDHTGNGAPGVLLSGGQWQRLALARALRRGRRDLLILDEPSSGLDAGAEHRIHRRIREHRRGRTSVLVSHRLNTVRDADRILVLADGRVAEEGDHDALMAAEGIYARLFRLQAAGYQADHEPAAAP
jgi:ATP-binding cassette subfamily B protein